MAVNVELLPWDPNDEVQVQRMYDQCLGFAWFPPDIPAWKKEEADGVRKFYWMVLKDDPSGLLERHIAKFPIEKEPIQDTTSTSRRSFTPVGHLALGLLPEAKRTVPGREGLPEGTFLLTNLYVSWPLQGTGVGAAAVDLANTIAKDVHGATATAVETITESWQAQEAYLKQMYDDRDLRRPGRSNVDWYAKRKYRLLPASEYVIPTQAPALTGALADVQLVWMVREL